MWVAGWSAWAEVPGLGEEGRAEMSSTDEASRGRKERWPRRLPDWRRAPELSHSYEPGDDTDDRVRRAVAMLLPENKGREGKGEAA